MKRGAEKQLSKDDEPELEPEDGPEPGQGFRKADENVLAGRKIRSLPKRASMANLGSAPSLSDSIGAPSSEAPPVPSVPAKFGGFGGFGSNSSSSNSFSFSSPAPLASAPAFGTSTTPLFGSNAPAAPVPSVSPSASGATKTFASFLGSTPSNAPASSSDKKEEIDPAELKYYTSLRGLNVSFMSAISKAVEQDPFTDISEMLTHYKNFRLSVQKDFDEKPKPPTSTQSFGLTGSTSSAVTTSMPKPPASFAPFGGKPSIPLVGIKSESTAAPPSSGFSFPASGSLSSPPKSAFGSTATVPDFLSPPKTSTDTAKTTSSFGASTFGSSSSPFGSKSAGGNDAPSSFNSSIFGSSTKPTETDQQKTKDPKPETNTSSLFGSGSSNLFGATSNTFGSSTAGSKAAPPFAGFGGAKSGSFGNPVGFGFGSPPPKTPEPDGPPASASVFGGGTSSGFGGFGGFSAPKPAETSGSSQEEETATDDSKLLPTKSHDEEGKGEEDEETIHTTKSKVYKLSKKDDGNQEWRDLGVGMLRLKKHKETGSRRVLLRNSSTGKITINFKIYSSLNPSLIGKTVTFVGHDDAGISATYRIRTQSDQHATEFVDALNREISFVKGEAE